MPKPSIPGTECQQCGRFDGEMKDPTFDAARCFPGAKQLWICELCAKINIESEMRRLGEVIN